jgi:hypothetical protein
LALPHGARLKKLENLETVRTYVATHAEDWYKYINAARGRGLANGSLYLVTGWEKAQSWGMASFHSASEEFQIVFNSATGPDSTSQYLWSGAHGCRNPALSKCYAPLLINDSSSNQTTFIHGLSISLGTGIWGRLFGQVKISEIGESLLGGANGNSIPHTTSQGSSFSWSFGSFGGGTATGGKRHTGTVVLSDISPIAKVSL